VRHWTLFSIAMPLWFAPRAVANEKVVDDQFFFSVDISHPLVGRIVRYEGCLTPVT
jgi:Domain of unknown function (DUF4166)